MNYYKNVYVKGYAQLNLGDDLFLDILFKRYPDVLFYIECADHVYEKFLSKYPNVKCILNDNFFYSRVLNSFKRRFLPALWNKNKEYHFRKVLDNVDSVIVIGGSMYMQHSLDLEKDYDISFYRFRNTFFSDKPIFFLGGNFGPFLTNDYVEAYSEIFKNAKDVCFRDEYSYNIFKDVNNRVRFNPDIVFSYQINVQENLEPESVGFSIVSPTKSKSNIDIEAYIQKYADIVQVFVDKNYIVKLFSFCKDEGDEEIIEKISSKIIINDKFHKIFYDGDIPEFLREFASIDTVFCGRFHSLILAMLFNQKIVPVSYSNKMKNILKDLSYSELVLDMEGLISLSVNGVAEISSRNYDITKAKDNAVRHFEKLDDYLIR